MEAEIDEILKKKPYNNLKFPFRCQRKENLKRQRFLHEKIMMYCDLLVTLSNDRHLWKKHEIPERIFHTLRLRYKIVGNVLKAIFLIHEKNKEEFLRLFKTEYVKTFTFSKPGKIVKIVVLKPVERRQPLSDLSISTPRSRVVVPSASDDAFENLVNPPPRLPPPPPPSRISHPVPPTPQDITRADVNAIQVIPPDDAFENLINPSSRISPQVPVPPIRQNITRVDVHAIEVAPENEPENDVIRRRGGTSQLAAAEPRRIGDENYTEEDIENLLGELGLVIGREDLERINSMADVNDYVNKCFGAPQSFDNQTAVVQVQPVRPSLDQSHRSDDIPRLNIQIHAELHSVPDCEEITQSQNIKILKARRAVFHEQNLFMNQAHAQVIQSILLRKVSSLPTNIAAERINPETTPVQTSSEPMPGIVESAVEMRRPATPVQQAQVPTDVPLMEMPLPMEEHPPLILQASSEPMPAIEKSAVELGRPGTPVQQVQVPIDVPLMEMPLPMEEHPPIPVAPTAAWQNLAAIELAIDRIEKMTPPIQERDAVAVPNVPARQTIAELLLQTGRQPIPPEVNRALEEQPGPFLQLPPSVVPVDAIQNTRPSSPLYRLHDLLEDTSSVKKTPVKRKKVCFYSQLVISRKLKKNIKPQTYVSHARRIQIEMNLQRHPDDRIIPFDVYEEDQPEGEGCRYITRFKGFRGDALPRRNLMANLICQLFERDDDDGLSWNEDNEGELRKERVRASIRTPRISTPQQSPLRVPSCLEIPPAIERISTNLSNIMDVSLLPSVLRPSVPNLQIEPVPLPRIPSMPPVPPIEPTLPQENRQILAEMPIVQDRSLVPSAPVAPTSRVPALSVSDWEYIQRDRNVDFENMIPEKRIQIPVPTADQSSVPKSPVPAASIQLPEMEITAGQNVPVVPDKNVDLEEVIPQKRVRRGLHQEVIADIAQIPANFEQQPRESLVDQNMEQRLAEFQRQSELVIDQSAVNVPQTAPTNAEMQPLEQTVPICQTDPLLGLGVPPVSAIIQEQDESENYIPVQRPRITKEDVMDKLTALWMGRFGEAVSFTDLCPIAITNRFTAAKTFSVLLNMSFLRMVVLAQKPEDQWLPESLKISPP